MEEKEKSDINKAEVIVLKSTISELKKKLYEQQIRAKGLYTFEEYKDMRNVLQTLRMKFAAYEEWDLYQHATDLMVSIPLKNSWNSRVD
ncbi:hypothetical protein SR852_03285 [Bacillus licheniformis]|uniref:hypothetical protein n=1 Tax=unclassified Bacillus (in: firmicutes) TaxID=185979 RepID=UPI0002D6ED13|nr:MULTISPECIES: hypothetical protein [Bacillus]KUL06193.1 hypothetical protein LI17339_21885 [Bacillus licheniformis LMG 17339]NBB44076.1 hypothetical protein [Bacillus sp. y1(2019)]QCY01646.1 hypothetical protein EJ992_21730 [Bacillus licheniformis]TWJ90951.1 hypothetical protein CHCC20495_2961 [Bacillus licheniformis]TWL04702.1 hypothetical protein CHCC20323_0948 [Bacillus licheniformis]